MNPPTLVPHISEQSSDLEPETRKAAMSLTPEHDKIDEVRKFNPLAVNLLHLLLDSPGWVLSNQLAVTPVEIPISRIAAGLLGIDAAKYREEVAARFGLSAVPVDVADTVNSWAQEEAVLTELRELRERALDKARSAVEGAVAESPLAASAFLSMEANDLVGGKVPLAEPDPEVPSELRGTLAGAAVSVGALDADTALAHAAASVPLTESQSTESTQVNHDGFTAPETWLSVPAPTIRTDVAFPSVTDPIPSEVPVIPTVAEPHPTATEAIPTLDIPYASLHYPAADLDDAEGATPVVADGPIRIGDIAPIELAAEKPEPETVVSEPDMVVPFVYNPDAFDDSLEASGTLPIPGFLTVDPHADPADANDDDDQQVFNIPYPRPDRNREDS